MVEESLIGERIGNYRLLAELGRGGMGTVYQVSELTDGRIYALKLLRAEGLLSHRFGHEFRAVKTLDHPGIAKVYEWGMIGSRPYFVMDYIDGEPLDAVWKPNAPARNQRGAYQRLAQLLVKVSHTLEYVHNQRLVHRDIKPANILIDRTGNPVLMDFGLATSTGVLGAGAPEGMIAGSLAYMCPEQLLGRDLDVRADLYSLGVTIFEVLTGRLPYFSKDPYEVMRMHLNAPLPSLHSLVPEAPEAWERIVGTLLAKSPAERYQSAGQFSSDLMQTFKLNEIQELQQIQSHPGSYLLIPPYLDEQNFVPRIEGCLRQSISGTPDVVFIKGIQGVGKSRLLGESVRCGRALDMQVFTGSCKSGQESIFAGFDQPLQQLLQLYGPDLKGEFQTIIRRFLPAITLPNVKSEEAAPITKQELYQLFDLVRNLVGFACQRRPVLIVLDDFQWANTVEVLLVKNLIERMIFNRPVNGAFQRGNNPLVFIIASREDENQGAWNESVAKLKQTFSLVNLELKPLSESATEQLINESLGGACRSLTKLIYPRTGGVGLFVLQYLEVLIDENVLVRQQDVWRVRKANGEYLSLDHVTGEDLSKVSYRESDILRRRFSLLPPAARRIVTVASVATGPFSFAWLHELTGVNEEQLWESLDHLLHSGIITDVPERELTFAFKQHSFRNAVYEQLDPWLSRELHLRSARALESIHRGATDMVCEYLAYHYVQGDHPVQALSYLFKAGEKAASGFNYAKALNSFEQGLEIIRRLEGLKLPNHVQTPCWMSGNPKLPWFILEHRLGIQAEEQRVNDRRALTRQILEAMGNVHQINGSYQPALQSFRDALAMIKDEAEGIIKADLLRQIGQIHYFLQDYDTAQAYFHEALMLQQTINDQRGQANSLNSLGVIAQRRSDLDQALSNFQQTLELRRQTGNMKGVAYSYNNIGSILYFRDRFDEALECYNNAITILEPLDQPLGLAYALNNRAAIFVQRFLFRPALHDLRRAYELRQKIGDRRAMLTSLLNLLEIALVMGRLDVAWWALEEAHYSAQFLGGVDQFYQIKASRTELDIMLGRYDGLEIEPRQGKEEETAVRLQLQAAIMQGQLDTVKKLLPLYVSKARTGDSAYRIVECHARASLGALLQGERETAAQWLEPPQDEQMRLYWNQYPGIQIVSGLLHHAENPANGYADLRQSLRAATYQGLFTWQAIGSLLAAGYLRDPGEMSRAAKLLAHFLGIVVVFARPLPTELQRWYVSSRLKLIADFPLTTLSQHYPNLARMWRRAKGMLENVAEATVDNLQA